MKKYIKKLYASLAIFAMIITVGCTNDDLTSSGVSITKVNPTAIFPSETITVEGTGFEKVEHVFVGSIEADYQVEGANLVVTVPTTSVVGVNTITLIMPNNYRVTAEVEVLLRPIPVVATISPSAAAPGKNITLRGINLNNLKTVTIGGIAATVVSSTATQLVVTVPTGVVSTVSVPIVVVTAGGTATSTSTFYASENLLLNSELELGTGDEFTNWGKWNGGSAMFATSAAGESYTGRALKATGAGSVGGEWKTQFGSDGVATSIGGKYIVYMWIKGASAGGNIRFSTNESAGSQYGGGIDISTEWKQVKFEFTATSASTKIVLDMGLKAVTYFIDNITMVAISGPPPPTNLLLNGGLELGSGDVFTNWNKYNGGTFLVASTTAADVHGGTRALKSTNTVAGQAYTVQFVSDPVTMTVGSSYKVSMWIKGATAGGVVRFSTNAPAGALYGGNATIGTTWQQVVYTFTANDAATRIVLDLGTSGIVYNIDDIELFKQ
jgi:hypothetical protein